MSEDTDAKPVGRKQRTTRSERRRAGRAATEGSEAGEGGEGTEATDAAEGAAPGDADAASPFDTMVDVETDEPEQADGAAAPDAAPIALAVDTFEALDDDDARPTREMTVVPIDVSEEAKTLPRIRVEEIAARLAATKQARASSEGEAPERPAVIASRTVMIAQARIITDAPAAEPAVDARATEQEVRAAAAAAAAAAPAPAAPEPAPPKPPPPKLARTAPMGSGAEAGDVAGAERTNEVEEPIDVDVAELESPSDPGAPPPPPQRASQVSPQPKRPPPPPASSHVTPPPQPAAAPRAEDEPKKRKQARQWWERLFSEEYLRAVQPPTQAQVARQVDFIVESLGLERGATILDVGCGLGMHCVELTRRGYLTVGLDLSLAMITRAAETAQRVGLKINFVHADIREMQFEGAFDAVICLGTTFGFFDDEANRDVLTRLHHALRPGGRMLLDVANRDYVMPLQPNLVWFEGEECVCMEESEFNHFNSRLTVKRTMMSEDGRQSQSEYSVRLYSLHELGQLVQQMGFRVLEVSGHEAVRGAYFGACSPRILVLAERRPQSRAPNVVPERPSQEMLRPSVAMPPERASSEVPKPPKG